MTDIVPKKMQKLNTSVDVIPIQGTSSDDSPQLITRKRRQTHTGGDPLMRSRVQTYLYDNEDKVYIDVTEMADCLMKKYRDYRTKKREPFRQMVRRAYDDITESFSKKADNNSKHNHMEEDDDDEDEEDDDEEDDDDEIEIESESELAPNDALSNELLKMYKKSSDNKNGNSSDKELIDISTDDDDPAQIEDIIAREKIPQFKNNTISSVPFKNSNHNCHGIKQKNSTPKVIAPDFNIPTVEAMKTESTKRRVSEIATTTTTTGNGDKGKKRPRDKSAEQPVPLQVTKKRKDTAGGFAIKPQEKKYKFCDIGGNTKVLESVVRLLTHMKHPEYFKQLGAIPTRGFLLHGPPGCGKSLMAHAIAGELDVPFLKISAPELIAGVSGESESRIRELFEQALSLAPCVLFFDEIDALVPNRANSQKEMERRIVAQLLSCLDELNLKENGDKILVLGATNRPETIDPALRRAGRFDREVSMGIPDKNCRAKILEIHCKNISLSNDVDLSVIAAKTPGFVGADLVSLIREAAIAAIDRVFKTIKKQKNQEQFNVEKENEEINKVSKDNSSKNSNDDKEAESTTEKNVIGEEKNIQVDPKDDTTNIPQSSTNDSTTIKNEDTLKDLLEILHTEVVLSDNDLQKLKIENIDFETAFKVVQPSSKREGFATVPDVTWSDIGSLKEIREELQMAILAPVKYSADFTAFGLNTPTGVLLCGPPGCGKTLLAKAIANEAEINFISVKGPELLNMYVGESEKAVRQCFVRARDSAPCVIFFDEIDALCPKRTDGDNSSTSRIVNQVLTEMDGVEGRKGVYLMAATNRPDIIDPAVMRPGRFDKILYVGLPTPEDRVDILRALTKNGTVPKFADDTSMEAIGKSERCNGYTGADLAGLVREAATAALKESMANSSRLREVSMRHVEIAFDKVRPSVQEKEAKHYEKLRKQYAVQKKQDAVVVVTPDEGQSEAPAVDSVQEEQATVEAMET